MYQDDYLNAVHAVATHLDGEPQPLDAVADVMVDAMLGGHALFTAEVGHGNQNDWVNWAGGLATLLDMSPAASGDVLLIASTSGRNAVVVDMALRARDKGITVIGMTALAYTHGVTSRHPSGKKLTDLCDVAIDNGAPYGDAAVEVPGFAQKVAPLSSVTGCAIANALVTEVVEGLVARGLVPPVFMSANLDGGDAFNRRLLAENRARIHYL